MKRLAKENLTKGKIPNKSGIYTLYNRNGTAIYSGVSKKLRHRLQSYTQEDDFKEHPTKRELRKKAVYFTYLSMLIKRARLLEKKKLGKYNH